MTNHSSHAWDWFASAYGYDPEGPKAGIRYDAYTLTKADGKGKWWDGLDPQDLYTGPNLVMPAGFTTIAQANAWHKTHDGIFTENAPPDNPAFVNSWFLRCQDLVDKYQPDLLYFDDSELPFGQTGLDIAAHYYNAAAARNGGKADVVLNTKKLKPEERSSMVEDYERRILRRDPGSATGEPAHLHRLHGTMSGPASTITPTRPSSRSRRCWSTS